MFYVEENYHWFDEPFSGVAGFRRIGSQPAKQPERTVDQDNALGEQPLDYASKLFSCPVDGCVRSFPACIRIRAPPFPGGLFPCDRV